MKIIAIALSTVLLSLFGGQAAEAAPSKKADDCVVYTDWRDMERGTMTQVQNYLGSKGFVVKTQQGGKYVLKQYNGCNPNTFIQVFYALNAAGYYMSQYASWWNLTRA